MRKPQWARTITELRQQAGLSVEKLAKKSGFTKKSIYNWEQGVKTPDVVRYARLLKVLGYEQTLTIK